MGTMTETTAIMRHSTKTRHRTVLRPALVGVLNYVQAVETYISRQSMLARTRPHGSGQPEVAQKGHRIRTARILRLLLANTDLHIRRDKAEQQLTSCQPFILQGSWSPPESRGSAPSNASSQFS